MLTRVEPGWLEKDAARAWNAGPARAGVKLLGPISGYRNFAGQVQMRNMWCARGQCGNAAVPGTSNHGTGRAADLASPWMRTWIDKNGRKYGWWKSEAWNEWWHVNYHPGVFKPQPSPARFLTRAQRAKVDKLLYHRAGAIREAPSGKGPKYRAHRKWRDHYRKEVVRAAREAKGERRRVMVRALKRHHATSYEQLRDT
jgi:hypothetical protein